MPAKATRKPRQKAAKPADSQTLITHGADGQPVPRCPTDGWCWSEVERLGIQARGKLSADQAFAILAARGYPITRSPGKAARDQADR